MVTLISCLSITGVQAQWKPAGDKIKTVWTEKINPDNGLPVNNLSGDTLRLVTYNVYHFGHNPSYPDGNYQVIADILKDLNPDVVCLQELESVNSRSKGVYQAKQMADLNLWNYCFAGVYPYQGGRTVSVSLCPATSLNRPGIY